MEFWVSIREEYKVDLEGLNVFIVIDVDVDVDIDVDVDVDDDADIDVDDHHDFRSSFPRGEPDVVPEEGFCACWVLLQYLIYIGLIHSEICISSIHFVICLRFFIDIYVCIGFIHFYICILKYI